MNAVRIVLSSFIVQGRKTITNLLFHVRVKRDDIMTRLTDYKEPHPPPLPPPPQSQNPEYVLGIRTSRVFRYSNYVAIEAQVLALY